MNQQNDFLKGVIKLVPGFYYFFSSSHLLNKFSLIPVYISIRFFSPIFFLLPLIKGHLYKCPPQIDRINGDTNCVQK